MSATPHCGEINMHKRGDESVTGESARSLFLDLSVDASPGGVPFRSLRSAVTCGQLLAVKECQSGRMGIGGSIHNSYLDLLF